MDLFDELESLGVNINEGMTRLNGNKSLYTKLLGSFVNTLEAHYVSPDFDENDVKSATEEAHTIKGMSGNLSITPMYDAYTKIVELLRAGKLDEARMEIAGILPIQNEIVSCINKYKQ